MTTPDDATETLTDVVRRILSREIAILDDMPMLGEDGLDRLAKCALILQRIRRNDPGGTGDAGSLTDDQLMKKAG